MTGFWVRLKNTAGVLATEYVESEDELADAVAKLAENGLRAGDSITIADEDAEDSWGNPLDDFPTDDYLPLIRAL